MGPPTDPDAASAKGLSSAEVRERVAAGLVNRTAARSSRTFAEILRTNLFTRFNALLGALLAVILIVGPLQDALFGLVIVANSAVGIVQELRAKRTLDRLSLLNMPVARVVRDGTVTQVAAAEVVVDDLLVLAPGDQIPVDAVLHRADELEIDESLLTGESDPVVKQPGDTLLSGSFVVAGSGHARATRVGEAAYAAALAAEARIFAPVHSQIRDELNRLLRTITWFLIPIAVLLATTQLFVQGVTMVEALRGAVAGVVGMVPEGLILLTSVAFATGIVRLGRQGVLIEELSAIEGLARADVLGIDKTGTLTEGRMAVAELVPLGATGHGEAAEALGALARADEHPNASIRALTEAFAEPPGWAIADRLPFSSVRKYSGVAFDGRGTWLLGAPEMLLPDDAPALAEARRRAANGDRIMLLARGTGPLASPGAPPPLEPAALVVLVERLRPDAKAMLRYFAEEGIAVKVISGDSPATVGAIAAALGLPGAGRAVDGRDLPEDPAALGPMMEGHAIFGRVTPHQKRDMVRALHRRGHVVAMAGDGVNDVLAIKEADIGVAMGSGTVAARAVAEVVLLGNRFAVLPDVVAEGRRIIANIERLASLFITKTVYVALLAVAVGVARLPFPFYPRHLTIVSTLTIGVPAFFLALAPNRQPVRPEFMRRVLRFALPAGFVAALATFAAFAFATLGANLSIEASRTAALVVLFGVGIVVLTLLILPLSRLEALLLSGLVGAFALVNLSPALRSFFAIAQLPPAGWLGAATLIAGSAAVLAGVRRLALRAGRESPTPATSERSSHAK